MKKMVTGVASAMLLILMISPAFAQTETGTSVQAKLSFPQDKVLNDAAMTRRLGADLGYRNADLGSNTVSWYSNANGYYGTYSVSNTDYITFYDKDGRYVETLKKGSWTDMDVPTDLKNAYGKSTYKSREVTGYWTVTDPEPKGYYLELKDKNGKMSRVWSDEKGKFTTAPPKSPQLNKQKS